MKHCTLCNKGSRMVGTRHLLRGHYNTTNRTRKYPNLQTVKLPDGKRVIACMQCKRTVAKVG